MIWFLIVLVPLIYILYRYLSIKILIPYIEKKSLIKRMRKRDNWSDIENKVALLNKLYKWNFAKLKTVAFRNVRHITSKDFTYGEIDFLSFYNILEKTNPQPNELFYDLGSGAGKAVFAAALFFNFTKACGIELIYPLYIEANNKAKSLFHNNQSNPAVIYLKQNSSIEFIKDSFFNYDFLDADVIYIAATCFTETTWENLIKKMTNLKPGTRIIVATKTIQHGKFELIYQGKELMSWGMCNVNIYKIRKQE